ncbi:MAG: hypothetical protein AVDCRST_MAG19-931, partial [uncultured Thermomicrobiales bacterium]
GDRPARCGRARPRAGRCAPTSRFCGGEAAPSVDGCGGPARRRGRWSRFATTREPM